MRYAGMIKNDFTAAPGVCVSFFLQGCPIHCVGCHNPECWDFDGGREFTPAVLQEVLDAIEANGIKRNFCVMGGEPLAEQNRFLTLLMCKTVREKYPDIKIYIWTGYTVEELARSGDKKIAAILDGTYADFLIDGPFDYLKRDVTLLMRGSTNQRIITLPYQEERVVPE